VDFTCWHVYFFTLVFEQVDREWKQLSDFIYGDHSATHCSNLYVAWNSNRPRNLRSRVFEALNITSNLRDFEHPVAPRRCSSGTISTMQVIEPKVRPAVYTSKRDTNLTRVCGVVHWW